MLAVVWKWNPPQTRVYKHLVSRLWHCLGGSYGPEYSRAVLTGLLHSSSGQGHQQATNSPTTIDMSYSHSHESRHAFSTIKQWDKTNPSLSWFSQVFHWHARKVSIPCKCQPSGLLWLLLGISLQLWLSLAVSSLLFYCCEKNNMTNTTYRQKSLFEV